jgi:hypothetical protein
MSGGASSHNPRPRRTTPRRKNSKLANEPRKTRKPTRCTTANSQYGDGFDSIAIPSSQE